MDPNASTTSRYYFDNNQLFISQLQLISIFTNIEIVYLIGARSD